MGKKFKFGGGDSGIRTPPPQPPPPTKPPGPPKLAFKAPKINVAEGEQAARVPSPQTAEMEPGFYSIADTTKLDEEINRRLATSEESAAKYSKPIIELENVAAVDENYLRVLAEQTGLRLININDHSRPPKELIRLLTAEQAKRLTAVPVYQREDGVAVIAIADPSNTTVTDDLRTIIEREIETVIAKDGDIRERIEQYYGLGDETLDDIVSKVDVIEDAPQQQQATKEIDLSDMNQIANAAPVIKLVNGLLIKAIKERASDIHIEPFPNIIRIRYRVDGVLREIPSPPRNMLLGIVSRIKVLSGMNISESRLPQDGRMKLLMEGREVDLRVSSMPTAHGEAIVMRILDKNMMMIGISQIGMVPEMLTRFMHHVEKPNGIVLVTGPTGCGKTTTLYAALAEIKDPGEKFITVEDPVEYELAGIVQVNINEGVGLTFAKCLRSILRQDPDKVLVGEIRDVETAQISIQASLTGHLVFSTLHTNSASATITRLIDMGIEPFLITSSVEAVVGQRLVRGICSTCRVPYKPNAEEMEEFDLKPEDLKDKQFFHGEGCRECGNTGYRGRMGLFELMEMTDEIRDLILDHASTDEIQEVARRNGMLTMRKDGWMKICLGLTTFEEVARETPRDLAPEAYKGEEKAPDGKQAESIPMPDLSPSPAAPDNAQPSQSQPHPSLQSEAAARVLARIGQKH